MHVCLSVDEIVRLIACELVASKSKATTVAFAGCRKSFEDPALDVLWGTQEELLPLLKCLPGDVWNEGGYAVSTPTTWCSLSLNRFIRKAFKRFPTTPEWARFRKYSRRMRKLGEDNVLDALSSEVFSILQLCAITEPLFPNIKTLDLMPTEKSILFVPLFLSPRTTTVSIKFSPSAPLPPTAMIASVIATFPTLCPNLQEITLVRPPRDPTTVATVSEMLLAINRNALRHFHVFSPLTEEAREVIYALPDLCSLSVVIERGVSLPSAVLPNLTDLTIAYEHESDWLQIFRGAVFGPLETVTFASEQIANLLELFESVALAASIQNTLSSFTILTACSWNPNYPSLHQFTQLTYLAIAFSCDDGCSSTVDDDVVMNLARTMPKLETLDIGGHPCREIPIGVTAKGLVVLAHCCPGLSNLRIHFQVTSLSTPPAINGVTTNPWSASPRRGCALGYLEVGHIPVSEESVAVVALTLAHIFPHITRIGCKDGNWLKVVNAICLAREVISCSSK